MSALPVGAVDPRRVPLTLPFYDPIALRPIRRDEYCEEAERSPAPMLRFDLKLEANNDAPLRESLKAPVGSAELGH